MTEQFQKDFFPETRTQVLTLEILTDDWAALQQQFRDNQWETADGLRYTLAAGLAHLQAEVRLSELNHPQADLAAKVRRLQNDRMSTESLCRDEVPRLHLHAGGPGPGNETQCLPVGTGGSASDERAATSELAQSIGGDPTLGRRTRGRRVRRRRGR